VKRVRAVGYGALVGAACGLTLSALLVGKFALHAVVVENNRAAVQVTTGSLYLLVVVTGLLGGLLVAAIMYGIGYELEPDSPRFAPAAVLPAGAVVAALFAYTVLRVGVGMLGEISEGVATIGSGRLVVVVLAMGLVAGAMCAAVTDALARPAVLGFEGEAIPRSAGALVAEMARAVGTPLIAVIAAATFAISLSQLLLALEGTAAVAVFSGVAALVLGGATLIALRPWAS